MLNNKTIMITGGTGSFGKKFTEIVLRRYPNIKRLVIFSRDELKQYEMARYYPSYDYPQVRFFIGDVRDQDRLRRAMEGIDTVIHAAALKQVPVAEYNPMEFIKTNIIGAENVITAALDSGVERVVALSTDKAAAPINLYGATKLCSDKLFVAANNIKGGRNIRFSVVRYGNIMGSRGSVIPLYLEKRNSGVLPITHPDMTRFNISLEEGVKLVLYTLEHAWGGEIFIPKIPSYRIIDVAKAIAPECRYEIIGIRPGEKIHEELITESDSYNTLVLGQFFAILPQSNAWSKSEYLEKTGAREVKEGFRYSSDTNTDWLTVDQLRVLIQRYVDPGFDVQR